MSCRRRRGFSLLEILVVIGIISLLIAILMPALRMARRAEIVMASPIVYEGSDKQIHLTNSTGGADLTLTTAMIPQCPACHSPPVWSPSGQTIAFRQSQGLKTFTAILNPMRNTPDKHDDKGHAFMCWIDSTRYLESDRGMLYARKAETGESSGTIGNGEHLVSLAPAPATAPAPFIAATSWGNNSMICFLRKDFTYGPKVWVETKGGTLSQEWPRVDPLGEYVAWTKLRSPGRGGAPANGVPRVIALKGVHDPLALAPDLIGQSYKSIYFCDWTEGGDLLANASDDGKTFALVILDRKGNLKSKLNTDVPPAEGVVASWRKYGHR